MVDYKNIPRWRGFNLHEMFVGKSPRFDGRFREDDFRWMSEWGFDFARIPMSYIRFVEDDDIYKVSNEELEKLDRVVEFGQRYDVHVCLNLHRAPGYCINNEESEPFSLWHDKDALDAFCWYWGMFAERYKGISTDQLSFDLINEPKAPTEVNPKSNMGIADYVRVIKAAVEEIRKHDPNRLIIIDGLSVGNTPCLELADTGVAQSCRAYIPFEISHYKARWVDGSDKLVPAWPLTDGSGRVWNKDRLAEHYKQWNDLRELGIGVHCGEGGAYNHTPHDIVISWLGDVLEVLTSYNIGYALWNFRGPFGILDSDRDDVDYVEWYGHKLDQKLLALLQKY